MTRIDEWSYFRAIRLNGRLGFEPLHPCNTLGITLEWHSRKIGAVPTVTFPHLMKSLMAPTAISDTKDFI